MPLPLKSSGYVIRKSAALPAILNEVRGFSVTYTAIEIFSFSKPQSFPSTESVYHAFYARPQSDNRTWERDGEGTRFTKYKSKHYY